MLAARGGHLAVVMTLAELGVNVAVADKVSEALTVRALLPINFAVLQILSHN